MDAASHFLPLSAQPSALKQLVYASQAVDSFDTSELEDLLTVARYHNRKAGITGVLIVHEDRFMQCLEGPPEAVDATFARIQADRRHRAVEIRLDQPVVARAFAAWNMACTEVDESRWLTLSTAIWVDSLIFADGMSSGFALLRRAWEGRLD